MLPFANKSLSGIVLVSLLLFLQIFIIIDLYILQSSILSEKISFEYRNKQLIFVVTEQLIKTIETNLTFQLPACLIETTSTDLLLTKSIDWWRSSISCKGKKKQFDYYYVVESLGQDACAEVRDKAANYFRITLLVHASKNDLREILQTTIIKLDNTKSDCKGIHHTVAIGRQQWRTLQRSPITDLKNK